MPNPILSKRRDRSLAKAIKVAFADGRLAGDDLKNVLRDAWDGNEISDVEYRDLKRWMRTELRLTAFDRSVIEIFLQLMYPLEGPFFYPGNVFDLDGKPPKGDKACAKLVQLSQPIGKAKTWREGQRVRGATITVGTAVATFEDGLYPNRDHGNHVAYYLSQDSTGVTVMDQYDGKDDISSRVMPFKGQFANGLYVDPSNNGAALSVIMRKKR